MFWSHASASITQSALPAISCFVASKSTLAAWAGQAAREITANPRSHLASLRSIVVPSAKKTGTMREHRPGLRVQRWSVSRRLRLDHRRDLVLVSHAVVQDRVEIRRRLLGDLRDLGPEQGDRIQAIDVEPGHD